MDKMTRLAYALLKAFDLHEDSWDDVKVRYKITYDDAVAKASDELNLDKNAGVLLYIMMAAAPGDFTDWALEVVREYETYLKQGDVQ